MPSYLPLFTEHPKEEANIIAGRRPQRLPRKRRGRERKKGDRALVQAGGGAGVEECGAGVGL